jgi:hypothetical protein
MFPQWVIVGGLLLMVVLLVHPFWTTDTDVTTEAFQTIQYQFQGDRWTNGQILNFSNQILNARTKALQQQSMLQTVLADYLRVSKPLEQSAYDRNRQAQTMDPEIRKTAGLDTDQVQDYYRPMNQAKKQGNDPIVAIPENPRSLRTSLPQIVFPLIGKLDTRRYYEWYSLPDGKERYEKEEDFYKQVELVLPSFLAAIREFHDNAIKLRRSAGATTWGLRPRVEKIRQQVEEAEKKANEQKNEGFQNPKCEPVILRQIKTIPYTTYFPMAQTVHNLLEESQELIQNAETDLQIAERILKDIQNKADTKRERARATASS